jgi:hypothetical protein
MEMLYQIQFVLLALWQIVELEILNFHMCPPGLDRISFWQSADIVPRTKTLQLLIPPSIHDRHINPFASLISCKILSGIDVRVLGAFIFNDLVSPSRR